MWLEYYPNLFKIWTYSIFLSSLAVFFGLMFYPRIKEVYLKLWLKYYKSNKHLLIYNPETLTYSYK